MILPLEELSLEPADAELPRPLFELFQEADRRILEYFHYQAPARGFVSSCFRSVYQTLSQLQEQQWVTGDSFCEWGSGFGVNTCTASWLGFEALGIEIDLELVEAAESLADDLGFDVEFHRGSFIPPGADDLIEREFLVRDGQLMMETLADSTYEDLGVDLSDFDLLFAYPWPDDTELTQLLFERYASHGALLLTYNGLEGIRVERKV